MRYAKIYYCDLVNGEGPRVSIFVSGCSHHCKGCFNQVALNPCYGEEFNEKTKKEIFDYIKKHDDIYGISLLGGDPTYKDNIEPLIEFIEEFNTIFPTKDVWIWSGYTYEEILSIPKAKKLVSLCKVLVDGKYEEDKRRTDLYWRGSLNQRVIDIKSSLKNGKVVLYKNYNDVD